MCVYAGRKKETRGGFHTIRPILRLTINLTTPASTYVLKIVILVKIARSLPQLKIGLYFTRLVDRSVDSAARYILS